MLWKLQTWIHQLTLRVHPLKLREHKFTLTDVNVPWLISMGEKREKVPALNLPALETYGFSILEICVCCYSTLLIVEIDYVYISLHANAS